MRRGMHAANIRVDSDRSEDKFDVEELASILAEAKAKLPPLVTRYAEEMTVSYEKVFVKAQKTRWGSCSSKGNINLNCLLLEV